ncbi:argininosuccinate lyase [Haladaptatus sp. GCM10025707]|uniref:argininosuccinate lyase n=1 Tax=Haladaptatus sp. GCM10025707 TaxID=3252658 RepID=UPI00360B468F
MRVAVREQILEIIGATLTLREQLLARAAETTEVVFPAYTHSQPAQPITFAHYLLGFDHLIGRDVERLCRAFAETNRSPLGAAAIGGTGFPLNRERLAELSGFDGLVVNTYDAIASVDYLPETTAAVALLMTNISRMSQDLLVWSMFELGFVELSNTMSTTSSIMPQKKNPGVLEKTRAYANESIGQANSTLISLKAVPYGDVGETTYLAYPFLGAASNAADAIHLFAAVIDDIQLNDQRMYQVAQDSFCTMTELADTLVRAAGLSFRQAHEVVSTLVRAVYEDGRHAGQITLSDLETAASITVGKSGLLTNEALVEALDPQTNVTRRDILGGTAPKQNHDDLSRQRALLDEQTTWFHKTRDRLAAAKDARATVDR